MSLTLSRRAAPTLCQFGLTLAPREGWNEYLALARAYESLAETRTLFAKLQQRAVILHGELDA
jgi:hypothetical protein